MRGPRSLHIISSLRRASGGPTQSVIWLCEALNELGAPAEIATVWATQEEVVDSQITTIQGFPIRPPARLRRSPDLSRFLDKNAHRFDLIHVHGLWEWPGFYARKAATHLGLPLVISPRGMLEPWSLRQNRAIKRVAMALWERRNLQSAALLHATSSTEASQFQKLGFHNSLAIIPNGLAFPEFIPILKEPPQSALFLSRFHPVKGADLLLQAWAALPDRKGWTLNLVGPDEQSHRAALEALARALGLQDSVTFRGPEYGDEKWALLRQSSLLVLPSHSENFGNVVAEALSQGVPVIASQGTPWHDLVTHDCGWWAATTVMGIKEALTLAIGMEPHALAAMGQRGMNWSRSTFTAEVAAKQMLRHYQDLLVPRHLR